MMLEPSKLTSTPLMSFTSSFLFVNAAQMLFTCAVELDSGVYGRILLIKLLPSQCIGLAHQPFALTRCLFPKVA